MINKSYKTKNHEYERKEDGQVSEDATAMNVNKIHKQRWNYESSQEGEATNIRLQEHSSDCLCGHIKRHNKAGNE